MFTYSAHIQTLLRGHKYALLSTGVLLVGSSENQLERFGEEDRRCRSSGK